MGQPQDWKNFFRLPIVAETMTCFQSVQLAVVLLSLLAIGTLIGVVMPQEGNVDPNQIPQQFGVQYGFFKTLGFFNVFSSFWYISLEVLFFFNLLIGSFKWLKRATLAATQKTFFNAELLSQKPEAMSLPQLVQQTPQATLDIIRATARKAGYTVYHDDDETQQRFYLCKGNLTRFGPHLAHIGILMCLLACLLGSFTGFKAQKLVVPGDAPFDFQNLDFFQTNIARPYWLGQIPTEKIAVKKFDIELYPNGQPKQYSSDVRIYDEQGETLVRKIISVNNPLIYKHLSIYQASFTPSGRFDITLNGRHLSPEINNQFNERAVSIIPVSATQNLIMLPFFAGQDEGIEKNFAAFVLRDSQQSTGQMPPNIKLEEGQSGQLGSFKITYTGPRYATGLQIKSAPEVPWMYLSFIIISIGAALSFFSQRQIWISLREVAQKQFELVLCPKTNKGWFSFRKELQQLQAQLCQKLAPSQQEETK